MTWTFPMTRWTKMNLYDISVFLREHNNYEILTHNYPDGDTLGSGYALCIALQQLGKTQE